MKSIEGTGTFDTASIGGACTSSIGGAGVSGILVVSESPEIGSSEFAGI